MNFLYSTYASKTFSSLNGLINYMICKIIYAMAFTITASQPK